MHDVCAGVHACRVCHVRRVCDISKSVSNVHGRTYVGMCVRMYVCMYERSDEHVHVFLNMETEPLFLTQPSLYHNSVDSSRDRERERERSLVAVGTGSVGRH